MSKICPECRKEVRSMALFCEYCGNKFPKELTETDKLREDLLRKDEKIAKLQNELNVKEKFSQEQIVEIIKQANQKLTEEIKTIQNKETDKIRNEIEKEQSDNSFDFTKWQNIVLNKI